MTDAKARLLQMIADEPHMGGGGLLKAVGKAQKMAKAAETILPAAEREANLAKMLADSKVKDRLYHATKNTFDRFKPSYAGTFLTRKPEFANEFAEYHAIDPVGEEGPYGPLGAQGARILPVHVQVKNPFDYQNPEHREILLDAAKKFHGTDKMTKWINGLDRNHNFDIMESNAMLEPLKNAGFDSYYISENGNKNLAVFDPTKIKSAIGNRGTYDLTDPDITKAGGGLLKAIGKAQKVAKAAQPIVSAAEHEANLARLLAPSKAPMRLYHGTTATEGGKGTEAIRKFKPSKEGALGSGVYLTPSSEFGSTYAGFPAKSQLDRDLLSDNEVVRRSAQQYLDRLEKGDVRPEEVGGNMLPVYAQIKNPLILEGHPEPGRYRDPMIEALTKLGMGDAQATKMVERAYDQKGYIGKEVESRARAAGYDGLMQYRNGELREVVSYNPNAIKSATGNRGTFDINDPDLSKAHGGAVHMAGGGRTPKYPWERYEQPKKVPEMRARQITPVAGAVKKAADYATQLIDKGPSFANLVGGLVGAIPFVGPDMRKRMEASDISIPTDITLGSNMPAEDYEYGQPMQYKKPGISTTSVPTKDVLEALKVSDLVGTPGLSKVAEDIGYGQMPDPLDLLDAASVAALGYGAIKGGLKGAQAAKQGALSAAKAAERFAEKKVPEVMERGGLGAQMLGAFGQNTQSQAVKPKGGNWVDTEVKNTLSRFKQDEEYSPLLINATKQDLAEYEKNPGLHPEAAAEVERLRRDIAHMEHTNAFNKWVDTKFGGYLRNQMGTPDDPVVKSIDMRTMKAQADLEAGQKRLASLDSRIAEAEKTAITPDELNQLAGMKRNREQRAAELQSNYDLTVKTMLPFGEENMGYDYIRGTSDTLPSARKAAGFPVEGLAQSRPGKAWEAVTDTNIYSVPAEQFQNAPEKRIARNTALNNYKKFKNEELPQAFEAHVNSLNIPDAEKNRILLGLQDTDNEQGYMLRYVGDDMKKRREEVLDAYYEAQQAVDNTDSKNVADNPYLTKLPPESMVHTPLSMNQLGIDHVLDVLKQDVATGVLKLEDLNKITMEQALKRASEYDLDLAKKSRDSLAQNRSTLPVYKEYPEGHKWVQLTKPGDFAQESEQMGHSVKGYEPPKGSADWSESSGDAGRGGYGHGGWEAIKSGRAKVYSLVDANHRPHVTVEVRVKKPETWNDAAKEVGSEKIGEYWDEFHALKDADPSLKDPVAANKKLIEFFESKGLQGNQTITQIKGKGNKRPVDKYDQYTQDFVRSGNWSGVEHDLNYTGLRDLKKTPRLEEYLKSKNADVPRYLTENEYQGYESDFLMDELGKAAENDPLTQRLLNEQPRMAGGGLLKALTKAQKTAKAVKAAETAMQNFTDIATPVIRSGTRKFDVPAAKTSVIKETGGNWLGGNVEQALKPLRKKTAVGSEPSEVLNELTNKYTPEAMSRLSPNLQDFVNESITEVKQGSALNNWIDSNLTNYVKKQMATPNDPVRKLAEEGILHIPVNPQDALDPMRNGFLQNSFKGSAYRSQYGGQQLGQADLAKDWENAADAAIQPISVQTIKKVKDSNGPGAHMYESWMDKADPNTSVHMAGSNFDAQDLGFNHIVDVLKEDIATGRIRPEQLSKVSMEQAVRRTYEYDQEMAKKMRETQAKVTEGMPVHKDYSDKGYKWIELKAPDYNSLPLEERKQMIARLTEEAKQKGLTPEDYIERYPESQLAEALKYEGNTMGHCVGGYCPDVLEGRSRIFSLRDAKGEPHVTVEVEPNQNPYPVSGEAFARLTPAEKAQYGEYVRQWRRRNPDVEELTDEHTAQALKEAGVAPQPDRIVQIKGKQNRAPKEEYLPYVQDFVKSGNWSDVGDFGNTDLVRIYAESELAQTLGKKGLPVPKYASQDEVSELLKQAEVGSYRDASKGKTWINDEHPDYKIDALPEPGMAEGGDVKSFFEEKSAKQRLLDMIAEEPHMGIGVRPSRLQLQGEIANDTYGGIGGGVRATYTHPIGSDAAIRAYMEGGGYKPKDEPYKGQVNNMGISYEMGFKDGGETHMAKGGEKIKPLSERFNFGKAGNFDPIGNAKKTLSHAFDVASKIPGNLQALVSDPAAYIKALPKPTEEQMLGAFMPGDMGMAGIIKPRYLPGVDYADPLVPPTMKMSEALGNVGAEGKTLNFTETDRSRVFGPNRGGAGFAGLQHYSLPHKEANTVWGFGSKGITEKKVNQNDPENTIWTTYAGSPTQHKSNTVVVKDALGQLQTADKSGLVNPKQIELINDRIRGAVSKKGKPLFPSDFDITDPKAFDFATTFDRRAAISDALMGIGVKKPMISKEFKAANPGVKWQDAANIEAILKRETDPAMMGANTFDVGPNLFVMDNGIIHRPDLNEAFPYQVTGTDLGMRYELAPFREAAPDWIQARGIKPDEPINAWAMSRAAPSQFVSDKYLTGLQKKGRKEGGLAQIKKVKRHGNTVSN